MAGKARTQERTGVNQILKSGLYAEYRRMCSDGRTRLGRYLDLVRSGLDECFEGATPIQAQFVIDRIVFKTLRCMFYELSVLGGGVLEMSGIRDRDRVYLAFANSLRTDCQTLEAMMKMHNRRSSGELPSLEDYILQRMEEGRVRELAQTRPALPGD